MKRNMIALLGAALILFVWQFASWMALKIHDDVGKYTPAETEIMTLLNNRLPDDGMYMMPGIDPSKPHTIEEMEKRSKECVGKPYAMVFYNKAFNGMDPMNMVMGFVYNMIAAMIAIMMVNMSIRAGASSGRRFLVVMSMAVFCLFQSTMLDINWWHFPWHYVKGHIIDMVIGWALCGLFLSWYLGKASPKGAGS